MSEANAVNNIDPKKTSNISNKEIPRQYSSPTEKEENITTTQITSLENKPETSQHSNIETIVGAGIGILSVIFAIIIIFYFSFFRFYSTLRFLCKCLLFISLLSMFVMPLCYILCFIFSLPFLPFFL